MILIIYGISSVIATYVHEIGHLLAALVFGAKNLSIDFNLMTASYANWDGPRNWFTYLGGALFTFVIGLPLFVSMNIQPFWRRLNLIQRFTIGIFSISTITTNFLYLLFSIIIGWGDGNKLVEVYGWPKFYSIIICLVFGLVSLITILNKLEKVCGDYFKKSSINTFLAFIIPIGIIFIIKSLFGELFKYTYEYILSTFVLTGVLLAVCIKFDILTRVKEKLVH